MKGLVAVFLLGLLACGGDPHRGATVSGINAAPLSVSGFVSTIQLTTTATSAGSKSPVTAVTFIPQLPQSTPTTTITFCGNVANQFTANTFATVQFTEGVGCSNMVSLLPTAFVTIAGRVSIVQLTASGSSVITLVTFILQSPQAGLAETLPFCGNLVNQFVVNSLMTVSFSQGQACSTVSSAATI